MMPKINPHHINPRPCLFVCLLVGAAVVFLEEMRHFLMCVQ